MENDLIQKITDAFSIGNTKIYGRERYISKIHEFLEDNKCSVLNIAGNPGTGKTSIVLHCLKNYHYKYINYFTEKSIKTFIMNDINSSKGVAENTPSNKTAAKPRKMKKSVVFTTKLRKSRVKLKNEEEKKHCLNNNKFAMSKTVIYVIDEFDKWYEDNLKECNFIIHLANSNNFKVIAIGNNLKLNMNNIFLKPYTSEEILNILIKKMDEEIGSRIINGTDLNLICKKFSACGDMRQVFSYIMARYDKQNHVLNKEEDSVSQYNDNIHHKMINKVAHENKTKRSAYSAYVEECKRMKIKPLFQYEFNMIFERILGKG